MSRRCGTTAGCGPTGCAPSEARRFVFSNRACGTLSADPISTRPWSRWAGGSCAATWRCICTRRTGCGTGMSAIRPMHTSSCTSSGMAAASRRCRPAASRSAWGTICGRGRTSRRTRSTSRRIPTRACRPRRVRARRSSHALPTGWWPCCRRRGGGASTARRGGWCRGSCVRATVNRSSTRRLWRRSATSTTRRRSGRWRRGSPGATCRTIRPRPKRPSPARPNWRSPGTIRGIWRTYGRRTHLHAVWPRRPRFLRGRSDGYCGS